MPGHSIRDFDLLPTDSIKRHLAAIVAADVVGYSRLMGVNEKGTLLGLRRHRA
jgi:adenylate cyclase